MPAYGLNMRPDITRGLKVYVDASFVGEWNSACSEESTSVLSRTGYIIKYANCPIIWSSKLQTEITMSTTEAEYVALSQAIREVIPLMQLLNEVKGSIRITNEELPEFKCKAFEDNQKCIKLAKCPRMQSRTKHIAMKYHHFKSKVIDGIITMTGIDTNDQQVDLLTKNLDKVNF
eukprot:11942439-Ditylum_brightwellii.AAC.1